MEDYSPDILTVEDEDGQEYQFEIIDRIETDDDKRYIAVIPVFNDAEELLNDNGELIILRVIEDEDGDIVEPIEDEAEFDEIGGYFKERLSEYFGFDEEEEE